MRNRLLMAALCLVGCDDGASGDNDAGMQTDSLPLDAQIIADADLTRDPMIFVTAMPYPAGGGMAGADAACMADPNHPGSGTFKALLGGTTRGICTDADCASGAQPVDWVLAADTTYTRTDGQMLFTTNANRIFIDWPMAAPLADGINQASGLDRDWTVRDGLHCDDWTTASGDQASGVGWTATFEDGGFLNGGMLKCERLRLVCVEQR